MNPNAVAQLLAKLLLERRIRELEDAGHEAEQEPNEHERTTPTDK